MLNSEIVLKLVGSVVSSPLCIGITFASFNTPGRHLSWNDLLKIITSPSANSSSFMDKLRKTQ